MKGVRGQQHAPVALYPQERPSTHFAGGWLGPRSNCCVLIIYRSQSGNFSYFLNTF